MLIYVPELVLLEIFGSVQGYVDSCAETSPRYGRCDGNGSVNHAEVCGNVARSDAVEEAFEDGAMANCSAPC